jgi:uncharacterized protein (DUF1800 family)
VSLKSYSPRAYSLEDTAHLARRAAFGGTPGEIREWRALGPRGAVERLLAYPPDELPDNPFDPRQAASNGAAARLTQLRWLHELVHSPYPLRERLTLFWSNHFVIGIDKVKHAGLLGHYLLTLRRYGLDRFERLTLEVARAPAMLRYLDNDLNVKGRPNENFARELLELFTTGIGHYTEADVREGARAFTGWTFRGARGNTAQDTVPEFFFNARQHDADRKTFLGRSGNLTGEEVVAVAAAHPATSEFVSRKLWRAFVNDTPDEAGVRELAAYWRDTRGDLRAAVGTLLQSEAFYAPGNRYSIHKGPVHYVVGALRALGRPPLGTERQQIALLTRMAQMGQELLHPPTVEGWKGGREWVNDASLLLRVQVASALTVGNSASLPERDLPLALLGLEENPLAGALAGLEAKQRAFLLLASPEYAVA